MRCTQFMGLPIEAREFLDTHQGATPRKTCDKCGVTTGGKPIERVYKRVPEVGMFNDGPDLSEYTLTDGSVVREEIQDIPWSSGPCIFLRLVDSDGDVLFEHSQKAIDRA